MLVHATVYIILGFIFAMTPYLGRRGSVFGVLLGEAARSSRIKALQRIYRHTAMITAAVCLLITLFTDWTYLYVAYMCLMVMLFAYCQRRLRGGVTTEEVELSKQPPIVVDVPDAKHLHNAWLCVLLPLFGVTLCIQREQYLLIVFHAAILVLCLATFLYVKYAKHYVDHRNANEGRRYNISVRRRWETLILVAAATLSLPIYLLSLIAADVFVRTVYTDAGVYAAFIGTVVLCVLTAYRNR